MYIYLYVFKLKRSTIRNWYNQIPNPTHSITRETSHIIKWRQQWNATDEKPNHALPKKRWLSNPNISLRDTYITGKRTWTTNKINVKHERSTAIAPTWNGQVSITGGFQLNFRDRNPHHYSNYTSNTNIFDPREGFLTYQWINLSKNHR